MEIKQERRDRVRQKRRPTILIQCEGNNKTEKLYFANFRSKNYHIEFGKGNCTDPVNMIKSLNINIKNFELNRKNKDIAYCVFDTDVDPQKQIQIDEAILRKKGIIELIKSNPCFEIWYLFHFRDTTRIFNSNDEVIRELKNYILNYEKNKDFFNLLRDKSNNAIEYAKAVEQRHKNNGKSIDSMECNPSTEVYKIIEKFNELNMALLHQGKVLAHGDVHEIRDLLEERAHSVRLRCTDPHRLAARLIELPDVNGVRFTGDPRLLVVETERAESFFARLTDLGLDSGLVSPVPTAPPPVPLPPLPVAPPVPAALPPDPVAPPVPLVVVLLPQPAL
jgi:hypothetical protein